MHASERVRAGLAAWPDGSATALQPARNSEKKALSAKWQDRALRCSEDAAAVRPAQWQTARRLPLKWHQLKRPSDVRSDKGPDCPRSYRPEAMAVEMFDGSLPGCPHEQQQPNFGAQSQANVDQHATSSQPDFLCTQCMQHRDAWIARYDSGKLCTPDAKARGFPGKSSKFAQPCSMWPQVRRQRQATTCRRQTETSLTQQSGIQRGATPFLVPRQSHYIARLSTTHEAARTSHAKHNGIRRCNTWGRSHCGGTSTSRAG